MTVGVRADCKVACALINGLNVRRFLQDAFADRGYDTDESIEMAVTVLLESVISSAKES